MFSEDRAASSLAVSKRSLRCLLVKYLDK